MPEWDFLAYTCAGMETQLIDILESELSTHA